ncbi:ATP-binding cassette, subfamily C, CydD [Paenibacillus tianmuensis]|uniref:ATP-binding cassette, subfamily C, CydD n=1 Tax=Paenibacillus tianmuensis TaxID=624147 RepID=A0A1G4R3D5_9BACL|nr:thiol reductant ABC exporter subunit CydD [Paenibacillus tianmuensis]SCW50699.1 ATP-binding cassette, subfamily C, CydD [Paenibacillus tianmuensis]
MGKALLGYQGIKPVLVIITLLTLVQSAAILGQAAWLAEAVSALFAGKPLQELTGTALRFLLAFLLRQAAGLVQQKIAYRYAEKTGASLRKQLMEKLFEFGPRFAKTEGTGNLVTLVLDGISRFRTFLELTIPRMPSAGVIPAVVLVYVFWLDIVSGVILLVTMPILIAFMILIGLAARKQMQQQWQSYRVLSNHFVDSLRGLETLKVLGRSRSHSETIGRVSDKYRSATMRTLRVAFLSSFALDFFTMLSVASVAVSLGLRLVSGDLMLVTGLTVLILAPEYFLPIRLAGADYHATLNGKEAGEAIRAILDRPSGTKAAPALPASFVWGSDSELTLSRIQVRHEPEGPPSLQNVSVRIQGLRKIGIVGESGAGKSTLIDVLGGFLHPTSGNIELDGFKASSMHAEAWLSQTTYIPQHPYLFHGSLADNVRFYAPEAPQEEVDRAIAAAGLAGLVADLPGGSGEIVGNGGRPLSGGQEQRVALARAFLSRRPVMLLDEPTAHLDIETEYELKETMLSLFENKLVFLATHRLHWMPDMDWIIVLDQGRVAETGTHEELLANKGIYYELITSQREGIS